MNDVILQQTTAPSLSPMVSSLEQISTARARTPARSNATRLSSKKTFYSYCGGWLWRHGRSIEVVVVATHRVNGLQAKATEEVAVVAVTMDSFVLLNHESFYTLDAILLNSVESFLSVSTTQEISSHVQSFVSLHLT